MPILGLLSETARDQFAQKSELEPLVVYIATVPTSGLIRLQFQCRYAKSLHRH